MGYYLARRVTNSELDYLYKKISPVKIKEPLIRIGNAHDGGYVLVDDLSNVNAVFSAGVGKVADFELFFAQREIDCYLADATVSFPPLNHPRITFEKILIGSDLRGIPYESIETWVTRHRPSTNQNLILQMDIEGSEYEALISTSQSTLQRFSQLSIEFHHLHDILNPLGYKSFLGLIDHLLLSHVIVHTHANNCCPPLIVQKRKWPSVIEITFARLDTINVLGHPDWDGHELAVDNSNVPQNTWKYW